MTTTLLPRRRLLRFAGFLATALLVLVCGASGAAAQTIEPADAQTGWDHASEPPEGAFSSVDWCFAFRDASLAGQTIEVQAEGPSGPVSGTGTVEADGTVKVRVGITEGGGYTVTSITALDSDRVVDASDVESVEVLFDPEVLDCSVGLTPAVLDSPTTTGATPPTDSPDTPDPTEAPADEPDPPIVDPEPVSDGGSSTPWWLLFGAGLLMVIGGGGLYFAPKSKVPKYDYVVEWVTKTNERFDPLAKTVIKPLGAGCMLCATYRITVATQLEKVEPDAMVKGSGEQQFHPRHHGSDPHVFLQKWNKQAVGGGDGTLTSVTSNVVITSTGKAAADQETKAPKVAPVEAAVELVENVLVRVELIPADARFKKLLEGSHELFGKAQSSAVLTGATTADSGLHNLAPPVFEIEPTVAAAVTSSLEALNYVAQERPTLKKSVKGKLRHLKGAVERSELGISVGPLTLFKFSLGFEKGADSANKDIAARVEGGPAVQQRTLALLATAKLRTEVGARSKIAPQSDIDRHAKTWSAQAKAEVSHQLLIDARVEPTKYKTLATDLEETCMPSLRLSLGRQPKLPAGSDLSADFDQEKYDTAFPFDGKLWVPADGSSRLVFDLDAPAFHQKPGITSAGTSEDGGVTMDPKGPGRPKPDADETIKCWTFSNQGKRRLQMRSAEKASGG